MGPNQENGAGPGDVIKKVLGFPLESYILEVALRLNTKKRTPIVLCLAWGY
jgi:hypothetical protein